MENIIYRRNKLFCIDKSKIKSQVHKDDACVALYAAIYTEFAGAIYNKDYKDLTSLERLGKVNEFANKWLSERGLI